MLFPGIVDSAESSLFSYHTDENWMDFSAPEFAAVFEPIFATSELESQAYSICNGDQFCLFDIAATGRIDVGMSTQIGGQALEEIIEISAPSKCTIFTHYNTVAVADSGGGGKGGANAPPFGG